MALKYAEGDKFKIEVELTIDSVDETDITYYLHSFADNGGLPLFKGWISEEQLENIISPSNPQLKKAILNQKLEKVNKEREEIEKQLKEIE